MNDYSQYGESTLIKSIIEKIGTINRFGVEFGASDGFWLSNLRMFLDEGWTGLQMEGGDKAGQNGVQKEFITRENINSILDKYEVPEKFDLLSIDIDGNDYWIWKEITRSPNVVIIEYNSNFDKDVSVSLEYNPENYFDGSYAYSASFRAMVNLAKDKGYYLYAETGFNNLIFVKNEFLEIAPSMYKDDLLKLPEYQHGRNLGHKKFIDV